MEVQQGPNKTDIRFSGYTKMSRLDKFLNRIDEKISKKEIISVLKDPNIYVGAEFEFILEDLNKILRKNRLIQKRYMSALKAHIKYIKIQNRWIASGYKGEAPKIPKELIDYDLLYTDGESNYSNLKDDDLVPEPQEPLLDWNVESGYFDDVDIDDIEIEDNFVLYMKIWMKEHEFPFGNYKIGFYGDVSPKIGDNFWGIEPDPSLGESGVELKSPVLPLKDFMNIVPQVFEWIKNYGRTTSATGFHVNMSIKGISNLKRDIDMHKLVLFLDEEYIYKFFASRKNNEYAESLKKKILKSSAPIASSDIEEVVSNRKIKKFISSEHHDSITFEGLDDSHPTHIEFRYMGGASYHKKWSNIKPIVARYAHYLNIAVNPNYKKKEYLKKLLRVLRKAAV